MQPYPKLKLNFSLAPKTQACVYLDNKVSPLNIEHNGPFALNKNGDLICLNNRHAFISKNNGDDWQKFEIFKDKSHLSITNSHSIVCCDDGTLVVSFINAEDYHFNWVKKTNKPTKNSYMHHYVVRSKDGGKSWQAPVKIQTGYAAAATSIIKLKSGALVLSAQNLDYQNGRHYSLSFRSEDNGKTWQASNVLDIGGQGHHDGCYEGTLIELEECVWYCIRTNLDYYWHAYSFDDGKTWTSVKPGIEASSSPAMLKRLKNQRLLMVYNTLYPQGAKALGIAEKEQEQIKKSQTDKPQINPSQYPRRAGLFSVAAASWQREELVAIISDDNGVSWSKPKVLAQCSGAWLAYPYIHETQDEEIWVTTMQSELRVKFKQTLFDDV